MLAKAQPAVATAALEQSQAVHELFTSNLKLGLPSAQQAAKQLLVQLYEQVSNRLPASLKEHALLAFALHVFAESVNRCADEAKCCASLTLLHVGAASCQSTVTHEQLASVQQYSHDTTLTQDKSDGLPP